MRQITMQPRLVHQVYEAILDDICQCRLKPGERLAQERLAKALNVSRQPVGQALSLLKAHGFLCDAKRRGLMVAPLDASLVRQIYEFRGAVDGLAASRAAANWTAEHEEQANAILQRGHIAAAAGSLEMLIAADMDFHRFIYDLSANRVISDTMGLYWNHMRRVMSAVLSLERYGPDKIWREHEAIVRAVAAGDVSTAAMCAHAHVADAAAALLAKLGEDGAADAGAGDGRGAAAALPEASGR